MYYDGQVNLQEVDLARQSLPAISEHITVVLFVVVNISQIHAYELELSNIHLILDWRSLCLKKTI